MPTIEHVAAPASDSDARSGAAMANNCPTSIDELIADSGMLGGDALARARLVQQETGERLEAVVTRLGLISELALARRVSAATDLPVIATADYPGEPILDGEFSPAFLRDAQALPIAAETSCITLALVNPFDDFATLAVGFVARRDVRRVIALPSDLDAAIDRLYGAVSHDGDGAAIGADEDDLERLKDMASDAPVIRAVNRLVGEAVEARASDIHVEPADDRLVVRLRIDGVLRETDPLPAAMRAAFVSRVKVMGGLNIAEKRLPQDGRLRMAVRGHEIDLRVATAPSIHGESVVMRILDRSHLALDFTALGFDDALKERFLPVLRRPHGIVLVTGPTGSGKTTTLYAALAELNQGSAKLLTVEDPIEYRLPGVIQTQVNPAIGLTFATALRSFLRQDPDVMMVGEIRDVETAQIAVQAALTGHTILSTLHTNSAAAAVTRLIDMAVEPFLLSSTLNAVLAQRLVRRLCECREEYAPSAETLASFGIAAGDVFHHAVGCPACKHSGFRGRIALLELLVIDESVRQLVLRRAEAHEVGRAAVAAGMRPMIADGLLKARAGLTTLEEILRVTRDD